MPARQCAASAGSMTVVAAALAVLAGLTAASSQSAPAPTPENAPAAWRVECSGDGKTLECRALQQIFHRETRQLLMSLQVRPAADGKSGAMIVQVPLGVNVAEPVLLKVDNGPPEKQSIQTCTNVGCFIVMTVADKFLAAMRTGSEIKITVQDANKKPVEMGLPLLGFGLAFDKAK